MKRKRYSSFYILKNALKATLRNKVQIIGLILLIILTATIFTLMQTTSQRVYNSHNQFVSESNLHDFVIDLRKVEPKQGKRKDLDNVSYAQKALEKVYQEMNESFDYEYREGRMIFRVSDKTENLFKVLAYDKDTSIDKLILLNEDSRHIQKQNEAIISPEFARRNNYEIGDYICLQSNICDLEQKEYNALKIVGFGSTSDYMYPQLDITIPIPNQKRESLVYVHPKQFGLIKDDKIWKYYKDKEMISLSSKQDQEIYFVGKWKATTGNINDLQEKLREYFSSLQSQNEQFVFVKNDRRYDFYGRVNNIDLIFKAYQITTISLLIMTVVIAGFIILLVTKKRVENSRAQIGILKSLGYSSINIASGFLMYPFIASVVGGIIGYFLGLLLQIPIINVFKWYFTINFGSFNFNIISVLFSIFIMFLLLGTITFIASLWYVKGPPLKILSIQENKKSIVLTRMLTYLNRGKSFTIRFRWAIFAKSLSKMVTVAITMLAATMLLTLSITGPKTLEDMRTANYKGINYNSVTEYETPIWNSPLSNYAVYNPEFSKTQKGVNSAIFSPKIMKEKEGFKKVTYQPDESTLFALSVLNYTLFDWDFYLNASLSNLEPSNRLNAFKAITCSAAVDNWISENQEKWTISDCIIHGTTKRSPYFVRSKLLDLKKVLRQIETETTIKVLENEDLTKKENMLNKDSEVLSKEENTNFLERINDLTENDDDYEKRYEIVKEVFVEIKKRLNNVELEDEDDFDDDDFDEEDPNWNRYLSTFIKYRNEVIQDNKISNEVFNIQFGLLTYNPDQDELATYFKPEIKKINNNVVENSYKITNFKAYGIQRNSRMHSLLDKNSNDLLEAMYQDSSNSEEIPIVINQTLAKHWQINQGDVLEVNPNKNSLINAKTSKELENEDWKFGEHLNTDHKEIGKSLYLSFQGPTAMYKAVSEGKILIKKSDESKKFKVIGIQEAYGDAKMFLIKESADILMGYITENEKGKPIENTKYFARAKQIFKSKTKLTEDNEEWKKIFPNKKTYNEVVKEVFPIFNAKFSFNRNIKDITSGISVTQLHGDFSPATLNGIGTGENRVVGLGQGSISFALPIAVHQNVFDEIKGISDAVLYAFMAISLLISFIIILLTSNIIISENNRLISTMKVIGYNDYEINRLTLGMYLPVIFVAFIIGFPTAWFLMGKLVNYLALNSTWVMPFYFNWGLIFIVLGIILVIYTITFIIGWIVLKRMNALDVLKIND